MSFLDRVTKVVGDVVDRGKKEVDQFVRIQKLNGEIGDMERRIAEFRIQIQQAHQFAGEKAVEMLRAGALVCPDLQGFVEQIIGVEKQIETEEAQIAGKRAEIEKIKAERLAERAAAAEPPPPLPTEGAAIPPPPAEASAAMPPPATRYCPQCGAPLAVGGAFCTQCGTKVG